MSKPERVKVAEKHDLMRSEGLWLTSGGRVVKPGWGEYAAKPADQFLLNPMELEQGLSFIEFRKRLNRAIRRWKKEHPNTEPMG